MGAKRQRTLVSIYKFVQDCNSIFPKTLLIKTKIAYGPPLLLTHELSELPVGREIVCKPTNSLKYHLCSELYHLIYYLNAEFLFTIKCIFKNIEICKQCVNLWLVIGSCDRYEYVRNIRKCFQLK